MRKRGFSSLKPQKSVFARLIVHKELVHGVSRVETVRKRQLAEHLYTAIPNSVSDNV
jgi:hypothetical protein